MFPLTCGWRTGRGEVPTAVAGADARVLVGVKQKGQLPEPTLDICSICVPWYPEDFRRIVRIRSFYPVHLGRYCRCVWTGISKEDSCGQRVLPSNAHTPCTTNYLRIRNRRHSLVRRGSMLLGCAVLRVRMKITIIIRYCMTLGVEHIQTRERHAW